MWGAPVFQCRPVHKAQSEEVSLQAPLGAREALAELCRFVADKNGEAPALTETEKGHRDLPWLAHALKRKPEAVNPPWHPRSQEFRPYRAARLPREPSVSGHFG